MIVDWFDCTSLTIFLTSNAKKIDEQNPLNTTAHTCGFWEFFFIVAYLILQKKEGFQFKPTDTFLIDSYKLPKYFGGL